MATASAAARTVEAMCQSLGAKLNSVTAAECLSHGFRVSQGESVKGHALIYRDFGPVGDRAPKGRVLLLGGIHGDEYASISIVFKWLSILREHHTGKFHWRVYPLTNPDGLLQQNATRTNANGVDLNRNFATPGWREESQEYWVSKTGRDPRRFPGKSVLSEPEAQWISREIDLFQPDVIISVHAPYNLLDFDGPPASPPKRLGPLVLSPLGTFPGSLGRYAWTVKRIPLITIELPSAGSLPESGSIQRIWTDMVGWMHNLTKNRSESVAKTPGPPLANRGMEKSSVR